jgi:GNAT superfamily N-acetyltransferase
MGDTWNFNDYFPDLHRDNLVNELFFQSAIIGMNYSQVIIDDRGNVQGYLFGKLPGKASRPLRTAWENFQLGARILFHYFVGHFGKRRHARETMKKLQEVEESLNAGKSRDHAYVGLFFVSSSLRGTGWGKRLMQNFEVAAQDTGASRLYLWTDSGCNYGFYDHYGFSRVIEVASPLLSKYTGGINGFAYEKTIDGNAPLKT